MPSANVELVRTGYDLINDGEVAAALDRCIDPEVDIEYHGLRLDADATYRGHAGVRSLLEEFRASFPDYRTEIDELIEVGENVVAAVRYSGHGTSSGIEIDQRGAHVWTFRDGKAVRWRIYPTKTEALAAAESAA
jgi:ketosteroid isomerase-like protein